MKQNKHLNKSYENRTISAMFFSVIKEIRIPVNGKRTRRET